MATFQDALISATKTLGEKGLETPRLDAELLLAHALGIPREDLLLRLSDPLREEIYQQFQTFIERRAKHEPVARIVGSKEFWSLEFKLNDATLVPRPDSETLVEAALKKIPTDQPVRILDLGTGSGCLLLAILSERPKATGLGVDASLEALACARQNAKVLGLADRATFEKFDWIQDDWTGKPFDLIISNPPYISETDMDALQKEVRDFGPVAALNGGKEGLDDIRIILSRAREFLKKGSALIMEIGDGQAGAVMDIFKSSGFGEIIAHNDLAGKARVISGTLQ